MKTERLAFRWPRWLKRGGILPDGNLYCYSAGLNCASFEIGSVFKLFFAPGKRSKHHAPELTVLAEKLNALLADLGKSQKGSKRILRALILDDQLCLTLGDYRPELENATDDEMKKWLRQGTDLDLLTAAEIQKALDL